MNSFNDYSVMEIQTVCYCKNADRICSDTYCSNKSTIMAPNHLSYRLHKICALLTESLVWYVKLAIDTHMPTFFNLLLN